MPQEEKDLKNDVTVEVTEASDDTDPSSQESEEGESTGDESSSEHEETEDETSNGESIESLKAKLSSAEDARKKAESDRDNYKKGMLSAKAKDRSLTLEKRDADAQPVASDVSEEKVLSVLYKQNEKRAIRESIDSLSSQYTPELVDDAQYQEIIGYLPRNIDRSSVDGIHRALQIAVKAWKIDRGLPLEDTKKESTGKAKLGEIVSETTTGKTLEQKGPRKRILPKGTSIDSWYT